MTDTTPRRVLVTGASEGLGQATALAFARAGCDVAVTDLTTEMLAETRAGIEAAGARCCALALDLRQEASLHAAMEAAEAAFSGAPDVLVNNAGCTQARSAVDVTWSDWDQVMDVNLKGSFFLTTLFARRCFASGRPGAVVTVASTHGLVGIPDRAVYGISKGGLVQMTRMLAIEWAARGIRVNAVAPGTVMTPSRERLLSDPARRQAMLARIPIGRFPEATEVAAAILYLASPEAGSITGHVLPVEGGLLAY